MENDEPKGGEEITGTLAYRHDAQRWQGEYEYPEGGVLFIWVTMATYICYLAQESTALLHEEAVARCRQLSYWHKAAMQTHDPEIHLRTIGRQRPPTIGEATHGTHKPE